MIIDNNKYHDTNVHCSTCGKTYKPNDNSNIKIELNVPPLLANIFCSRKCKEIYDDFLQQNKMNLDELFNINTEKEKPLKMSTMDFVNKTRMILSKIDKEYGVANQWKMVEEHEYEQQDCDNCKDECTIIRNGKELHCVPDKSEGECFVLEFDHESFIEKLENIMFHDDKYSFYDLLNCEVTNDIEIQN